MESEANNDLIDSDFDLSTENKNSETKSTTTTTAAPTATSGEEKKKKGSNGNPKKPRTKKLQAMMSPEKAVADRNALQALGMSVSKKNVDTMNTKKTIVKEVTRKRRIQEMETTIAHLETQEKKEKDDLAKLKRQKLKLESDSKVKFPVADELIESLDLKGPKLTPLPTPVATFGVPNDLLTEMLFIWNFLYVFSDELHLKPIPFDDLTNLLQYTSSDSFVLAEIVASLLRLLLRDHSLAVQISIQVPSHLNFASRVDEKSALENLKESACVEQHRDWKYNGLKLLPRKIRVDVVDGLRWQTVLRCVIPRLPLYKDLLRASDPSFDMLLALELREGLEGDGYKGSNKDWTYSILANLNEEMKQLNDALTKIELNEFYSLSFHQKITILRHLCLACYDSSPVRHLLNKHHEERNQSVAHLNSIRNSQKRALRQVSAAMKTRAIEECRKVNASAANKSKGGKKSMKKNPLDPSPAQLNAMLDDLILMESLKINEIMEPPDDGTSRAGTNSSSKTARSYAADEEKRKKERELTKTMREDAFYYLENALESDRDKDIRDSIRYAKQAGLEGKLSDGRVYCHPTLFKVYRHRANKEQLSKEQKVQAEHEKDLAKLFIRTEPMGYDRNNCAYYCFAGETRLWVQTLEPGVVWNEPHSPTMISSNLLHVRPSTRKFSWTTYPTMPQIWRVIEALDDRGVRERELKANLVSHYGLSGKSADGVTYQTQGSDYIGKKVRRAFGKRVVVGTIVGWLPPEGEDLALWHVVHDDGDEEDLEETEVTESLVENEDNDPQSTESENMEIPDASLTPSKSTSRPLDWLEQEESSEPDILFRYSNNIPGGLGLRPHQIGFDGLRQECLRMEGRLTDGLKSCGSHFQKEIRRDWENSVRQAETVSEFRERLLELEEVVHATQQIPDKVDEINVQDKRATMKQEGWIFDQEGEGKIILEELEENLSQLRKKSGDHSKIKSVNALDEEKLMTEINSLQKGLSMIGRRGRRFFDNHGKSDGTIIAFLRGGLNDGIPLWHMEHDDGDCEDLDGDDLEKVLLYFDTDAQEGDENEEEIQTNESGEESTKSLDEMSEESDVEENDYQYGSSDRILWPSLSIRTRWRQALSQSNTVGEIALALSSFMDYCDRYGITRPDPLDSYNTSISLVSRRMWRESVGGGGGGGGGGGAGRESIGRAPVKTNSRSTRSTNKENETINDHRVGMKRDARRSSLKAVEGNRRMLRDRAAKKMVSYLE